MTNYNKMYQSSYWKTCRDVQLKKQPFCVECRKGKRLVFATIVDHVIPHKGSWTLFTDENNLQSLCKYHHGIKSQKEKEK